MTWILWQLGRFSFKAHMAAIRRDCEKAGHPLYRQWQFTSPSWACPCHRVNTYVDPAGPPYLRWRQDEHEQIVVGVA